jgi:hypothetical protein
MRLAALVLLAACTTFDPIERGVCGNGLLEPGEDCDSPDPSCVACAVACTQASDCPNAGYTCGVDGLCHAPSGLFAQPTAPVLDLIDQLQIADIDRDGIGDVVGVSSTSIDVHYGDATAALASSVTIATPQQTGTVAFGDVDGDGVSDATIITEDGIVAFTSPYAAISAAVSFFPLTDSSGQSLDILATFPIDDLAFGIVVGGSADAGILVEQLGGSAASVALDPYCSIPTSDVTPDGLDSYTIVNGAEGTNTIDQLVTLYSKGSGASSREMCVTSIHLGQRTGGGLDPTGPRSVAFYNIGPTGTPPSKKPVFAELESSACPSLVQTDGSGVLSDFVGSMASGYCTIAGSATAMPTLPAGTGDVTPVGHVPLVPNVALVANDLLVLNNGLYAYALGTFTQVYKSERTLTAVATGDLDGDGRTDAVLVAGGEADLEVLFRSDNGLVPGYVVAPFQTAGVVTTIAIGDFDGNGTSDIAYTEQLLDHVQLSVGFGEPGDNFTPVVEGAFSATSSMITIDIPDSNDPASVISDLLVVEQLANGDPALTLLHGNPERTMLSYFEPRATNDPSRQTPMRQVVTGFFGGGSTQFLDIVAMLPGLSSVMTSMGPPPPAIAYRLDGTTAGLDPGDPIDLVFGEQVTGISDCTVGGSSANQPPCIRDATTLAWQTGSAHDVIIGVDHQTPPQAFRVDPWSFEPDGSASGSSASSTLAAPTMQLGSNAAVAHTAFSFDVDGDGVPELVLAFAPAETAEAGNPGLVESCEMDQTGTPTTCTDLGALVVAASPSVAMLTCVDAAAGNFAPGGPDLAPPSPTLLVLCHDPTGTSLLARVSGTTATIVASGLPPLRQIIAGDVTGDGVDDVVAIRGDSGDRALTVLVQCSSRDLACQAGAVAP